MKLVWAVLCLAVACGSHNLLPDAGTDTATDTRGERDADPDGGIVGVDVLLVIEQGEPVVFEIFRDAIIAAVSEWPSDEGIRVGVINTNLGVTDATGGFCDSAEGDGARLFRPVDNARGADCPGAERFFDLDGGVEISGIQCAMDASVDEDRCRGPQALEASLRALATPDDELEFFVASGTGSGQGTQANAGFRRAGVPLVLVFMNVDGDCSIAVRDFYLREPFGRGRCVTFEDAELRPIARYDAFRSIAPAGVHVFIVGGVAADLDGASVTDILADPRTTPMLDDDFDVIPTCNPPDLNAQRSPVRLLQAAELFADRVEIVSTCSSNTLRESGRRLTEFLEPLL